MKDYRIIQHIGEGPAQPMFDFSKPSFPANPYKTNTHKWRVWEHLAMTGGKITTREIHALYVDPTRVNDVKHKLKDYDYIQEEAVKLEDGNYLYQFVKVKKCSGSDSLAA